MGRLELLVLLLAILFLVGAGFAIYGLAVFISRRRAAGKVARAARAALPGRNTHGHTLADTSGDAPAPARQPFSHPFSPGPDHADHGGPGGGMLQGSAHSSITHSLFVRCLVIAFITLALLIPLAFVSDIVDERSDLRRRAVDDIASLWGQSQTINGPALAIPYLRERSVKETVKNAEGKEVTETRTVLDREFRVLLPTEVDFAAQIKPQIRHRGIYEYVVYTCSVDVKGAFRLPDAASFGDSVTRVEWEKAWLALGVTDLKAITGVEDLVWNGKTCPPYNPGTGLKNLLGPGFHAPVALAGEQVGATPGFSLRLHLNGSGGLHFTPVGESTHIVISGPWPHPSFSGSLLPATRTITDTDFTAEWRIPHLSRTYPQSGVLGRDEYAGGAITAFVAGTDLFETVSLYSQVNRAVKYGILFIGLTFTALLAFELVTRARLHLMQYGLVGIAMTLFYLALLSLAEHTAFIAAFAAAALISVLMNSLYIAAAMRSLKKGLVIAGLLSALYILLYALLQMEEYALLIGTGLVVLVVAILMYLTRHLPENGSDYPQAAASGPRPVTEPE